MKTLLVILLGLVLFTSATNLDYKDCGSKMGKIISIDAVPCPAQPCVVHKGANITVTVAFATNAEATTTSTVIHGIIAGIPAPFPAPCKPCSCGITCPLAAGGNYTYKAALPVQKEYPTVDVVAKWELQDQNKADIFCFEIPVIIKP
ncbi:NPC intracellular cholesterol transporter 2-like [Amphiura filiformis]|uniref:NPC intracellular cholesterol transporter 2-like n=1 Tax=Amphiura filiformis TaxID=82378 RepID=UPI003B212B56